MFTPLSVLFERLPFSFSKRNQPTLTQLLIHMRVSCLTCHDQIREQKRSRENMRHLFVISLPINHYLHLARVITSSCVQLTTPELITELEVISLKRDKQIVETIASLFSIQQHAACKSLLMTIET